jgi:hypothetical protein
MTEWISAAILRQCRRCMEHRPLHAFKTGGKVCEECVRAERRVGAPGLIRGYALTDKARAFLVAERAAA